ncbi:hypothetical protein KU6B_47980 [Mameliella alba]|uniref:hypothetical protein n=1 Tax=Mameliella alba TaxID=561184 RepID=UPI0013E4F325|nr:hypothetical protein [Mameliella alba]BBU58533.1 hypothetical protein KU6B_47980 [Mameliella alba]
MRFDLTDLALKAVILSACAAAPYLAFTTPVFPQGADVYTWPQSLKGDQAYVKIDNPEHPAAIATVTFHDVSIHGRNAAFTLHGAVPVQIEFIWRGGAADTVRITPPAGYVAIPAEITPGEGETGKAHIFIYLGG